MMKSRIELIPLHGIPLVKKGDDVAGLLMNAIRRNGIQLEAGDIVVVTHSMISIAEGSLYNSSEIEISPQATLIAERTGHSPSSVEAALREADEVIRDHPILVTRTKQGIITDFSGVDESNAPLGSIIALPKDPDVSAKRIHDEISSRYGFDVPIIVTDTQGRPWRKGAVNLAIGLAGMSPFVENAGKTDLHGRALRSSLVCLADQLAAASELVMGQSSEGVPAVIIRGAAFDEGEGSACQILRKQSENLFR